MIKIIKSIKYICFCYQKHLKCVSRKLKLLKIVMFLKSKARIIKLIEVL